MRYAEVTGWGKALPPAVLTNDDIATVVDTSDEWITTRSGIKERRISHVETSDMAAIAARRALAAAGKDPEDVDLIILATCTADTLLPSAAALVQAKIGATRAGAFDLNAACSGWVYAMVVGTNMIRAGTNQTVLVIGAEKLHYILDFSDRSTCVLFGDGAGAVVLEATDEPVGILSSDLAMDGTAGDLLTVQAWGASGNPGEFPPEGMGVHMDGREVFRRAVTMMVESSAKVVDEAGLTLDDIDLFIPHQANVRIIDAAARRLELPLEKAFVNIAGYGNTSAATIPIALTEAVEEGRIAPGDNLLFTAFGSGLSWGSVVLKWGARVEPLGTSDADFPDTDLTALEMLKPNFDFFGLADMPETSETP